MKAVRILLIEDNEGDILLTTEALAEAKIYNEVEVLRDGYEAIRFLNGEGPYANRQLPDLILLDVNLPKKNGHEVLMYIKNNEMLKSLPVIMLTTSSTEKDIHQAYKEHVNCYIVKPIEAGKFIEMVSTIEDFWFSIVQLPGKDKTS
jgi:CheY-like chemotaxis protein